MRKILVGLSLFVYVFLYVYTQNAPYTADSFGKVDSKLLLIKMRKNEDDMRNITFYESTKTTKYGYKKSFHLYIAYKKDQAPTLRLKIQYAADDWLFIREYLFKADDKSPQLVPTEDLFTKVLDEGGIVEIYDEPVRLDSFNIILDLLNAKQETKMRYIGKDVYDDFVIKDEHKQAMIDVLNLYFALGGEKFTE